MGPVAEDVLLAIYQVWVAGELRTTNPDDLLRSLARTMTRRRAIDAARRARVRLVRPAPHPDARWAGTSIALDAFEGDGTGSSTRIRRLDARERVGTILERLAKREEEDLSLSGDYELFVLRHADGLTFRDIAERRGRGESADAVRFRLRRIEGWVRSLAASARASAPHPER